MSTFQDVLEDIALVVGGTKQTAPPAGLYSGAQQGDGTGVSGLNGCFSLAPLSFQVAPPVGIVLPRSFRAALAQQGYEENEDLVRLLIIVAKLDLQVDLALANPFRDSVPAAFRAHMQLDQIAGATSLTPEPLLAFVQNGKLGKVNWGGIDWWAWEFEIRVLRTPQVTYAK